MPNSVKSHMHSFPNLSRQFSLLYHSDWLTLPVNGSFKLIVSTYNSKKLFIEKPKNMFNYEDTLDHRQAPSSSWGRWGKTLWPHQPPLPPPPKRKKKKYCCKRKFIYTGAKTLHWELPKLCIQKETKEMRL